MRLIPGLLTHNWTLKLAAVGLALLLWVSVRVDTPNRQGLPGVPVRVDLNDPRWALLGEPMPGTVEVRFSGPARELFRMALDRPTLIIPIDEVATEDTTILLRTQWIRIQDRPGVVVEDIIPSSVRLAFEPILTAAVPLAPRLTGRLSDDLAFAAVPSVAPSLARISGPASRMEQVDTIFTLPLDLTTITESGNYAIGVDLSDLERVQVAPGAASISIRVEPRMERTINDIPLTPEFPAGLPDIEFSPRTVGITLSGPRSVVEGFERDAIRMLIGGEGNLEDLEPGETRRVPIRINGIPDLVRATPGRDSVSVRIRQPDQ